MGIAERSSKTRVVILGGGPAGCGAAYQLQRSGRGHATLIEQQDAVGGNAGSFDLDGQRVDYGSHRLHHASDPAVLDDIKSLLGDELTDRDRHGRIRLRGRWLHFPLKPVDLMLRLDRSFAMGALKDMIHRTLASRSPERDTFASVLRARLGPTICDHFYFPYARKIWGRHPEELSGVQARKRVTAGSFRVLLKRLAKPPGAGRFYYPRRGFGQISEAYAAAAAQAGASLLLGWRVNGLHRPPNGDGFWRVDLSRNGETRSIEADHVWSTLPVSLVTRMISPGPPAAVCKAAAAMEFRAMILVYLTLDVDQFTTTDAHYFPQADIVVSRLSEPKNYSGVREPAGSTILCAEIPCSPGDGIWELTDSALATRVAEDMSRAGLPLARPPVGVHVRRLPHAYPIYRLGYEEPLQAIDDWLAEQPRFLSYGRQGLFAHDNTHHTLYMAYCAVDCLREGVFDTSEWERHRKVFASHVVED